jgi:murein DD-endopeptidase MepM/ murein hydrolase activator NlpD
VSLPPVQFFARRNLGLLLALCVLSITPLAAYAAKSEKSNWAVRWQPARLVNGSPIVFRVTSPQLQSLSATWLDHEVFFAFDAASKAWYGIGGVSLETRPGKYVLELNGDDAHGKRISFEQKIAIAKAKYPSIKVTVPAQYTSPSAEQLKRISEEKTLKQQVFAKVQPDREWAGDFLTPVKAQLSDVFGTARTFNGQVESVHQGLDYAVREGTPVEALNRGTVLLARDLFFEGGFVVLDHGQGLLTLYMHLSKIEVKEGDAVTRGQEIGLSGGTGRATGPHLHVAVRWQGIYVNPETLLRLDLP